MMNYFTAIICLILLSSCATMTTGTNQSLSVTTEPESGATCELSNDKGTWYIGNTPGSVTVNRAYSDLTVVCKKGDKNGLSKVKSTTKAMAAGNILCGGLVGLAVDAGSGAGYDYPTVIRVLLK